MYNINNHNHNNKLKNIKFLLYNLLKKLYLLKLIKNANEALA